MDGSGDVASPEGRRCLYRQGGWIWWHRTLSLLVVALAVALTVSWGMLLWGGIRAGGVASGRMLLVLIGLLAGIADVLAGVTLVRGRERVSWIDALGDGTLLVRTLNGTLRRIPIEAMGKRKLHAWRDTRTGFTWREPRLFVPIEGQPPLHIDLMDGKILDEEGFGDAFRWWPECPHRPRTSVGASKRRRTRKRVQEENDPAADNVTSL